MPKRTLDSGLLLSDALNANQRVYLRALRSCRTRGARTGSIHDLRTSIRRISADLELAQALGLRQAKGSRKRIRKELKKLRDLRDVQVQLRDIRARRLRSPAIKKLLQTLKRDRKREKRAAKRLLCSRVHAKRQTQRLVRIGERLKSAGSDKRKLAVARERALHELEIRAQTFSRASTAADPTQPKSMHQARISLKKLRYALEPMISLLNETPSKQSELLRSVLLLQKTLGKVQDANVMLATLERFACKHKKAARDRGFGRLREAIKQEHANAANKFLALRRQNLGRT